METDRAFKAYKLILTCKIFLPFLCPNCRVWSKFSKMKWFRLRKLWALQNTFFAEIFQYHIARLCHFSANCLVASCTNVEQGCSKILFIENILQCIKYICFRSRKMKYMYLSTKHLKSNFRTSNIVERLIQLCTEG